MFVNNKDKMIDLEIYQSRGSKTTIKDVKGFIGSILELEFNKKVIQLSHAITNQISKSCDSNSRM